MYILFRLFGWEPRKYWDMPEGDKTVVRAFLRQYSEEREKEAKELKDGK